MRKFLPVLLLCPWLAACGFEPLAGPVMTNFAMGGATVVSYSVLGQSPVDYGLSRYRKQNCDIRNPKKYEGRYCVDPEPAVIDPAVYCYRTLAETDCTNVIDPHNNGNQPIVGPSGLPLGITPVSDRKGPAYLPPLDDPQAPTSLTSGRGGASLTPADNALEPDQAAPAPKETDPVRRGDFK